MDQGSGWRVCKSERFKHHADRRRRCYHSSRFSGCRQPDLSSVVTEDREVQVRQANRSQSKCELKDAQGAVQWANSTNTQQSNARFCYGKKSRVVAEGCYQPQSRVHQPGSEACNTTFK